MRYQPSHTLPKFSARMVEGLRLPEGKSDVIHFDPSFPGFGLRVRASGKRTWIYQYTLAGNRTRRVTIGNYPALSLIRARDIAADMHAKVRLGADPAADKRTAVALMAETVGAVLPDYLAHKQREVRPRTFHEIMRYLTRDLRSLHSLAIAQTDRRTIAALLARIATENGPVSANRARAAVSTFFAWMIEQGIAETNPVIGTGTRKEASRDRVLSGAELGLIWNALSSSSNYARVMRLLILTGQRAREIGGLRWPEVHDDHIALPPERTKNGRPHVIPLVPAASEILTAGACRDGVFVFGRRGEFNGFSSGKLLLDEAVKPDRPWVVHDVRRSVATGMANLGVQPHVIEAVLNHVSGSRAGVAGIYNRASYESEKRAALELWAEHVRTLIKPA